jgi:hypothetical protein
MQTKTKIIIFVVVIVLIAAALGLYFYFQKKKQAEAVTSVDTADGGKQVTATDPATGGTVEIKTDSAGTVTSVTAVTPPPAGFTAVASNGIAQFGLVPGGGFGVYDPAKGTYTAMSFLDAAGAFALMGTVPAGVGKGDSSMKYVVITPYPHNFKWLPGGAATAASNLGTGISFVGIT